MGPMLPMKPGFPLTICLSDPTKPKHAPRGVPDEVDFLRDRFALAHRDHILEGPANGAMKVYHTSTLLVTLMLCSQRLRIRPDELIFQIIRSFL